MNVNRFIIKLCLIFVCFAGVSQAKAQNVNTSVKVSESGSVYQFKAKYNKAKTKQVQEYMTESLKGTGFKFTNAQLDAKLTLDGGINFYIKSYDGELALKFDKNANKLDDFTKFKKMCEGIKDIVGKN